MISIKNVKENAVGMLYKFSLFVLFITSLKPWFTWDIRAIYIYTACCAAALLYYFKNRTHFLFNTNFFVLAGLLVTAKLYCTIPGINYYVSALVAILPVVLAIALLPGYKVLIVNYITNGFALFLGVSLLFWVLYLLRFPLHNFGSVCHPANARYVYDNYFFFLRNTVNHDMRFCGIFLEPGHLGMVSSFLLIANKFQFKNKSAVVILVSLLLTLSLAAYLLLIVSYIAYLILNFNTKTIHLGVCIAVLFGGYIVAKNYNGGHNVINTSIVSRMEYKKSTGTIAGYNRFSPSMSRYFSNYITTRQVFTGIGFKDYTNLKFGNNAGYKVFILQYGIIGTMLIGLFYFLLMYYNFSKFSFILFIIYILAFLQRSYPFWECELLLFINAMPLFASPKNERTI